MSERERGSGGSGGRERETHNEIRKGGREREEQHKRGHNERGEKETEMERV